MKQTLLASLSAAALVLAPAAFALDKPIVNDPDVKNVRVAGVVDLQGNHEGNPILGLSFGVGESVYPLDEASLTFTHMESDDISSNAILLGIEERYDLINNLRPYAKAGIGYMWIDESAETLETSSNRGVFVEVGGGIIIVIGEGLRFFAEGVYQWGTEEMWLDEYNLQEDNVQFSGGVRLYY